MRALLYIPLTVLAVTAGGWAVSRALDVDPATFELVLAGGAALAAGTLAALPPVLVRHSAQPAVAQAALASTLIHMMGFAGVAGVVYLTKVAVGQAFPYWLFAFYFSTLIVLVAALAQQIKSAAPAGPTAPATRH